jgi:hypothetical protein
MRCNGSGVTVATVQACCDFVVAMSDLNRSHVTSRAVQVQVLMGLHQQVQMKCAACAGTGAEGSRVEEQLQSKAKTFLNPILTPYRRVLAVVAAEGKSLPKFGFLCLIFCTRHHAVLIYFVIFTCLTIFTYNCR